MGNPEIRQRNPIGEWSKQSGSFGENGVKLEDISARAARFVAEDEEIESLLNQFCCNDGSNGDPGRNTRDRAFLFVVLRDAARSLQEQEKIYNQKLSTEEREEILREQFSQFSGEEVDSLMPRALYFLNLISPFE